jgi:hypothetical protein
MADGDKYPALCLIGKSDNVVDKGSRYTIKAINCHE